jgi:hypothetical protein
LSTRTRNAWKLPAFHAGELMQRSADGRSLYDVETTTSGTVVSRYAIGSGKTEKIRPFPVKGKLLSAFGVSPDSKRVVVATSTYDIIDYPGLGQIGSDGPVRVDVLNLASRLLAYVRNVGPNQIELHFRNVATKKDVKVKLKASLTSWARRGERLAVCLPSRGLFVVVARGKLKPLGKKLCSPIWGASGTP